ncbi:hypothetical protein NDU88_005946 [Pleurodeles waltl]|uniref:Uncharacterized protein n=1 Tax=Pleurodeles waltl TaxID=8319 RepID=A0AAV7SNE0_PLEWA|nr:hypothetical protein NDU88_005946 [Pleurodeles waltl]
MGPRYRYPGGTSEGFPDLSIKPDIRLQVLQNTEDAQVKVEGDAKRRELTASKLKNKSNEKKVLTVIQREGEESAGDDGLPAAHLMAEEGAEDGGLPAAYLTAEESDQENNLPAVRVNAD